jgi:hypothetical protein
MAMLTPRPNMKPERTSKISMVNGSTFRTLKTILRNGGYATFYTARRSGQTTLMSAFPSSRRVNSWLHWKQLLQALPDKAGGTAVMTTVDHTLMRGSKPHDR